jgi:hypothetical protein
MLRAKKRNTPRLLDRIAKSRDLVYSSDQNMREEPEKALMGQFSDSFAGLQKSLASTALPTVALPGLSESSLNPAKWTYTRLGEYIQQFEEELDNDHEIGARLVSFGQTVVFHVERLGYYGLNIITFYGTNEAGEKVQLIQNVSQLSVLLVAVKKQQEKPRRIGFAFDRKAPDSDS